MDSQLGKTYSGMLYKIRLWVIGGTWYDHNVSLILTCASMQDSIKQQTLSLQLKLLPLKI